MKLESYSTTDISPCLVLSRMNDIDVTRLSSFGELDLCESSCFSHVCAHAHEI